MEDRKPRETRFWTESHEARLAHLREHAPTLGDNRKLRLYAILGSVLMLLTVAAFYMAMQIYKAATAEREKAVLIEVDRAPELVETETQKALKRAEAEAAAEAAALQQQLEDLKKVDLLEEVETPPAAP
jgi:cell division protein FtsX